MFHTRLPYLGTCGCRVLPRRQGWKHVRLHSYPRLPVLRRRDFSIKPQPLATILTPFLFLFVLLHRFHRSHRLRSGQARPMPPPASSAIILPSFLDSFIPSFLPSFILPGYHWQWWSWLPYQPRLHLLLDFDSERYFCRT